MLDGFRKELAVEAVVFGMMVTGLVGMVPCGAMLVEQVSGSGRVHPVFPLLLLTAVAVGYVAGSWRWQRVAAVVLESRLRAGGDRVWNVCAECRYSLNGLPHDDGRVVCPECGHVQIDRKSVV